MQICGVTKGGKYRQFCYLCHKCKEREENNQAETELETDLRKSGHSFYLVRFYRRNANFKAAVLGVRLG